MIYFKIRYKLNIFVIFYIIFMFFLGNFRVIFIIFRVYEWVFHWLFSISYCVDLKQWPGGLTFMHNSTAENLRGWRFDALCNVKRSQGSTEWIQPRSQPPETQGEWNTFGINIQRSTRREYHSLGWN